MTADALDISMMQHALTLARRGLGTVWPNPAVGAVIWRMADGAPVIVGRGFTQPGGRPHAETEALRMAGDAARGAEMAVTLEPCSHHGKTPPCCNAVRQAGIVRVVSAMEDPDPRVNGRGHMMLRAAGIAVRVGVMGREARLVNRGFIRRVVDRRPLVTVKIAQTADGFAARNNGPRLMITGEEARRQVHLMRAGHDAIMVGVGTVLGDDPDLTCRLEGMEHRSPVRVIIDTTLKTPLTSRIVAGAAMVPVVIVTTPEASSEREAALREKGVRVERVGFGPDGQGVDLDAAMEALGRIGFTRVLCEGGPRLAEALAMAGLVDSVIVLTGPDELAGGGLVALGPHLRGVMDESRNRYAVEHLAVGADMIEIYGGRS